MTTLLLAVIIAFAPAPLPKKEKVYKEPIGTWRDDSGRYTFVLYPDGSYKEQWGTISLQGKWSPVTNGATVHYEHQNKHWPIVEWGPIGGTLKIDGGKATFDNYPVVFRRIGPP